MRQITDALGRQIALPVAPQRIVSLCPSVTETLYALGLDDRIVGRTRFCVHPQGRVGAAVRVGGTKKIDYERLGALSPDLIVAVKEENTPEMVAELEKYHPVYVLDVRSVSDGVAMIHALGDLTGTQGAANALQQAVRHALNGLPAPPHAPKALYLIWRDPYMAAGGDTYIDSMLITLGYLNAASRCAGRYPVLAPAMLQALAPEVVFLSSEPYPFTEEHLAEVRFLLPAAEVRLVDGEVFSWYGARMREIPTLALSLLEE